MFSVNPSTPTDPSFYPRCGTDRASDIDQGSRSIIAKLHFLRVCCSIAASYHLPLHLSPSDGLHIEVGLAPPIQKLLHTVDMLCIDYYEARQRKNRANSWNDCHSRVEVSRQQAEKNLLGFRARAFQHVSLASGRTVFSSCGADPSKAKKRLSFPYCPSRHSLPQFKPRVLLL